MRQNARLGMALGHCGAPVITYGGVLRAGETFRRLKSGVAGSRVMSAEAVEFSWPQDWGRLLRLARQVAGLSLTELSARTGLSKGYLSKLESAHAAAQNPSRATLAALARALPSFRPL